MDRERGRKSILNTLQNVFCILKYKQKLAVVQTQIIASVKEGFQLFITEILNLENVKLFSTFSNELFDSSLESDIVQVLKNQTPRSKQLFGFFFCYCYFVVHFIIFIFNLNIFELKGKYN